MNFARFAAAQSAALLLFLLCGCTKFVHVQTDLVDQARRGIAMTSASLNERGKIIARYHDLQRKLLDDAFDQDVRERSALSPDWVIDHRRAYAAGLDALATARRAADEAAGSDRRTLEAVDAALQQLRSLQLVQSRLLTGAQP